MGVAVERKSALLTIDDRRAQQGEHVLYHPQRGTLISITSTSLQEMDLATGDIMGEATFDLTWVVQSTGTSDKSILPGTSIITNSALSTTTSSSSRLPLEHLTTAGPRYVVAILQSRYVVVWDLHDMVLFAVSEVEKVQKSISAIAASSSSDQFLFYLSEGSTSIRVTGIESKDVPKKISRKVSNRNSQPTALSYCTSKRLLACGSSDGSLQAYYFAEENTLGGKDDAAIATLLFTSQTIASAIVELTFAFVNNAVCLAVGYANRTVEVWELIPAVPNRTNQNGSNPQRLATIQLPSPLTQHPTADFAKKNGALTFSFHPNVPVLAIHWHGTAPITVGSVAVWGYRSKTSDLSAWQSIVPASSREDAASFVGWHQQSLVGYASTAFSRSLFPLTLDFLENQTSESEPLQLATCMPLTLEQYANYVDVRSSLLYVTKNPEGKATGLSEYLLQRLSLQTGESEKLEELPVWKTYQGKQLVPWKLLANDKQTAVCIQLKDRSRPLDQAVDDHGFSYAVVEFKPRPSDPSSLRVSCGAMLEALDVCFCDARSDESKQAKSWILLVLGTSGKSLSLQVNTETVENGRIQLQKPVSRIFATPVPLPPTAPLASSIGSRVLFLRHEDDAQVLQLSDDDLNLAGYSPQWTTQPKERVLDVQWNQITSDSSVQELLVAVQTTMRLVVLNRQLAVVAAYDGLERPQSLLWMAQTLVMVTNRQHLQFLTPLRDQTSRLWCGLSEPTDGGTSGIGTTKHTQVLSVIGDRLVYATIDSETMETKCWLRPVAFTVPLTLGFVRPPDLLKSILERELLSYATSGGADASNPLTNDLLATIYHDFQWKEWTIRHVKAIATASSASTGSSVFKRTSHLSSNVIASLFLQSYQWKDVLQVFLSMDPALEEYVLSSDDLGTNSAKLPSKTGGLSHRFRQLAEVLEDLGQLDLALKCLDLVGDDVLMLQMMWQIGHMAQPLITSLQKDWSSTHPSLSALTQTTSSVDSVVWRRHDLFSLLCCNVVQHQMDRRSRLVASIRPFDTMTTSVQPPIDKSMGTTARAGLLYWKKLAPEDTNDWIGIAPTPHIAADDPKVPNYALVSETSSSLLAIDSEATETATTTNEASSANAKMTIGPYVDEEDAVVAYWRFEEGSNPAPQGDVLESMDTSKRENHLQIVGFDTTMKLVTSSAPVDKGEDAKLQEEFALQFPSTGAGEWGAKAPVRLGNTLDIGFVFDEDPYRRKLTFEAWIRNYSLVASFSQSNDEVMDEFESTPAAVRDAGTRRLVCRKATESEEVWWEFSVQDGQLVLSFADQTVTSGDERIANAAQWQHIAFSVDITSPKTAVIKLFLHGRLVGLRDLSAVEINQKRLTSANNSMDAPPSSFLWLGPQLQDYEMTEVRLWASARTPEQLSDMKENYLGIAETKRRLKVAIHKRNCQCEKCIGRRQKAPASGGLAAPPTSAKPLLGFPSTPPAAGISRDRRRPAAPTK